MGNPAMFPTEMWSIDILIDSTTTPATPFGKITQTDRNHGLADGNGVVFRTYALHAANDTTYNSLTFSLP